MANPPFYRQHRIIGMSRQRDQERLFLRKSLVHHPVGRSVNAGIGDLSAPLIKLRIQIVHVAEGPSKKEVLPDIAERALPLALRLRTIRLAGNVPVAVETLN